MTLYETIITAYPELDDSVAFRDGTITLQNDGEGDHIAAWNYTKPIPAVFKTGQIVGHLIKNVS